ncbi:MAG TPA: hypothetical protein VGN52_06905 [Burkholderiales bacterium]
MSNVLPAHDRESLHHEFQKADAKVVEVLMSDANRFASSAHMRDTLNDARATRAWASSQLATLERPDIR